MVDACIYDHSGFTTVAGFFLFLHGHWAVEALFGVRVLSDHLASQSFKKFNYILRCLCTCLHERHLIFICWVMRFLPELLHLYLRWVLLHKWLCVWRSCRACFPRASNKLFAGRFCIWVCVLVHFIVPVHHILEAVTVRDIVHDDGTVSRTIVWVSDSSEPLLTSSIPLSNQSGTKTSFTRSPSQSTNLTF